MRVAYALLEGRFADALRINLLSVIAYIVLGLMLMLSFWDEMRGTQYYARVFRREVHLGYVCLLLGLVLIYWYVWVVPRL